MFDNLLSGKGVVEDDNEQTGADGKPMLKTKTITKNYGTRLGKPQVKQIFAIEKVYNRK